MIYPNKGEQTKCHTRYNESKTSIPTAAPIILPLLICLLTISFFTWVIENSVLISRKLYFEKSSPQILHSRFVLKFSQLHFGQKSVFSILFFLETLTALDCEISGISILLDSGRTDSILVPQ